ncbi:MAG: GspE/PulE family protein [Hyphomicrobium sp.]
MATSGQAALTGRLDPKSEEFVRQFSSYLVNRGVIEELAAKRAERAQKQSGERFDLVLSRLGLVSEAALTVQVAHFLGVPLADPASFPLQPLFAGLVEPSFLKSNSLLPVSAGPDGVIVALADPMAGEAAAAFSYLVGQPVSIELAPQKDIERAIDRLYDADASARSTPPSPATADGVQDDDVRQLADLGSEAPVIRLVNELITRAAEMQASDVHFEPREDCLCVRFRIDGILQTIERLPPGLRPAVTSRVKIMARLNIAEQRLPQDGRIKTTVRGREVDLRVSTMPTLRGESVVMRLLDRSSVALDFAALGFSTAARAGLDDLLRQPNGIVLVTGPTGSGKTTTLYAALERLNEPRRKIFTVEDPIEYQIAGINQIQVQRKIGLTFASALRSILRQDPDVILIGEMRDRETAEVAIQAALTGHLVLSTLHTNSAAATITRLIDMGLEEYLLASTIKGIMAQRLVRRICSQCSSPLPEGSVQASRLLQLAEAHGGATAADVSHAKAAHGCDACRHTGYAGRTTISELMLIGDELRRDILARSSEGTIGETAAGLGMTTMTDDGLRRVLAGETTLEEIMRAVRIA